MRNSVIIAILGLVVAGLSGCGGMQLGKARGINPQGSAFDTNLYAEYLTLSESEYDEADYGDSDTFANRAIAAGSGNSPAPEEVKARNLPLNAVYDLTVAHDDLASALGKGAAEKAPMDAAHAQAMYECWMQEQEENFQPDDIKACRAEFEAAMAKVKTALEPPMMAKPEPMPAKPAPMPAKAPEAQEFMVFFDFDSTTLSSNGKAIIRNVVEAAKKTKPGSVVVLGHTDRAGTNEYNKGLSLRRVESVVAALKAAGLPSDTKFVTAGYGEEAPRVETADGVRSAGNRRVQIVLNPM